MSLVRKRLKPLNVTTIKDMLLPLVLMALLVLANCSMLIPKVKASADRIYGDPSDGFVRSDGSLVNPSAWFLDVGDGPSNEYKRGFVKFDLTFIYGTLSSARLHLYLFGSTVDGSEYSSPPFPNPGLGDCLVIHIDDYMADGTLDIGDLSAQSMGNDPGVLISGTATPNKGYVSIDVTAAVQDDINNGRLWSAFMIKLDRDFDGDGSADEWIFGASDYAGESADPYIEYTFFEAKVRGVVVDESPPGLIGARWWDATIEEILFDSSGTLMVGSIVRVGYIAYPPFPCRADEAHIGDGVEAYGKVSDNSISLNGAAYYLIRITGLVALLNFDDYHNRMGSVTPMEPSTTFYFPHFHQDANWQTYIAVVNPDSTDSATVIFTAYRDDGTLVNTVQQQLGPGVKVGGLVHQIIPGATGSGWIRVESTLPVVGILNFDDYANRMGSMSGVTAASSIYFPHFHQDADWQTFYAIVNLGPSTTFISTYLRADGSTITSVLTAIATNNKIGRFAVNGIGWLRVEFI